MGIRPHFSLNLMLLALLHVANCAVATSPVCIQTSVLRVVLLPQSCANSGVAIARGLRSWQRPGRTIQTPRVYSDFCESKSPRRMRETGVWKSAVTAFSCLFGLATEAHGPHTCHRFLGRGLFWEMGLVLKRCSVRNASQCAP